MEIANKDVPTSPLVEEQTASLPSGPNYQKKGSKAAPGSTGSGKAAVKHIIRERYPHAFITSLPDNLVFGAEDGTFSIKAISITNKNKKHPWDPDFKNASSLYYKMISTADYMFTHTGINAYYIAFDIPQLVPPNKSFEQHSRRNGKDEECDAKGVPKISWKGYGVYLRPHTSLEEWPRIHAHSGAAAFKQAVSDVFCMVMHNYRPPPGKTLLISGMLSHPSKKDPSKLTTCRKVYTLHTPWEDGIKVDLALRDEGGNLVYDEYGLPISNPDALPMGNIPYLDEIDDDKLRTLPVQKEADLKKDYMVRLHDHVRAHRSCIPGLRILAGEAEVAMFYMVQLLSGNALSCGKKGADPNIPRQWLLGALGESPDFLRTTQGANQRSHESAPGVIIKSVDTDILCLSLACCSFLEQANEDGKRGGWSGGAISTEGIECLQWIDPTFRLSIYLDFCSRKIDVDELTGFIRNSLRIFDVDTIVNEKDHTQKYDSRHLDLVASNAAKDAMKEKCTVDRFDNIRFIVEDLMIVPVVYSMLLADMNPRNSVGVRPHDYAECNGYLRTPIHTFVAAVKMFGDDYVLPFIAGLPMGWFTNAVFSFSSSCNMLSLPSTIYSNVKNSMKSEDIARAIRDCSIIPSGYLNILKGALIECYSKKNIIAEGLRPEKVSMGELSKEINTKRQSYSLPKCPFYAPRAMRLLWCIMYNFLCQVCPEMVPNPLDMGWVKGTGTAPAQLPLIEPDSLDMDAVAKKQATTLKAAATRKLKKNTLVMSMDEVEIL